ncbi:MAG: GNAT family N-acetyltransferase [Chloroflexi bacterium]|nr:GNAT family N-acetyltransferase [Chloroflexota bacterium]
MYRETNFPGGRKIELLVGDRAVSSLELYDVPLRIGHITIRCGGIGLVGTSSAERGKGYARQLLDHTLDLMREEHYPISILFGIPGLYHKYGYAPALVECESGVATRNAEKAELRFPVREFRPADAPVVAAMCNRGQVQRSGSIVRDPASWKGFKWGPRWSYRLSAFVVERGSAIIGYACYGLDQTSCVVGEVGYEDRAAFSTLLGHLAQIAVMRRVELLKLHAPPDDPFIEYCRRYGCTVQVTYPYSEHGMAHLVDQAVLLEALRPLLALRLERAGLTGAVGMLTVETELGRECVQVGMGCLTIKLTIPQHILAQLVLGYRSVADALVEQDEQASNLAILALLFPAGYPYMWASDRF